ncbi:MAG: 23S rRNA (uracil(1939)-C(5))-methyltransferase RlmD [Clostridia bacterium]|nr:23S rRNA (uracil(1939)-C(5))-methyltransferase RlmD [Clostridia bacterium]
MIPYKNELFEAPVTGMTTMGYGVARHPGGQAVFVHGGVTGDVAGIRVIKAGGVTVGRVEKLISSSPFREDNACPSKRCGGCSYGAVTFEYEQELKHETVVMALKKQHVEADVSECVTDGRRERYRNKVCIPVSGEKYGYYARHSHELADCSGCVLASEFFGEIAESCVSLGLPLRHVCVRTGEATGETMLYPVLSRRPHESEKKRLLSLAEKFPAISSVVCNINTEDTNVILGDESEVVLGRDAIRDFILGCEFEISHRSFYQVNRGVTELLYGRAAEIVRRSGAKKVADLFCGAGTIGICCAKAAPGISVTGTEIEPAAVENARENARRNGVENVSFTCGSADSVPQGTELVITDPPRKGLSPALISSIISSEAETLVYVSCNPDTLARDAAEIIKGGFELKSVTPFNMFPRTGSTEAVAVFCRKNI